MNKMEKVNEEAAGSLGGGQAAPNSPKVKNSPGQVRVAGPDG